MAQSKSNKKPNILIIWGDDIGWFNISAYNHGIMGYQTPNIDRIAKEGALFTDWYGQQSCKRDAPSPLHSGGPCAQAWRVLPCVSWRPHSPQFAVSASVVQ